MTNITKKKVYIILKPKTLGNQKPTKHIVFLESVLYKIIEYNPFFSKTVGIFTTKTEAIKSLQKYKKNGYKITNEKHKLISEM